MEKMAYIFKNTNSFYCTFNANCIVLSKQRLNQTCSPDENFIFGLIYTKFSFKSANFGHKYFFKKLLFFIIHKAG